MMSRVLIVDDDVDLVQILTRALETAGYQVSSTNDPASGMEAARTFRPDIILLDYHMPGSTGAHLFESFRRNQGTAKLPIIFMSGEAAADDVLAEIADPMDSRFMGKPVRISELKNAIEEMLHTAH